MDLDKFTIFERVATLVSEQLDFERDKIELDTSFEEIDADSLDILELMMTLEEEFGLEVEDEEVGNIETVGYLVDYIREHTS